MAQSSIQFSGWMSILLIAWSILFLISVCQAEVLIQDVLWSKEYDEGLGENFHGMCTFRSSPCGTNKEGTCVQRGRCTRRGGTPGGDCQDGFGECCVFTEQCNATRSRIDVNQLVTRLKSPTPICTQCSYRFKKEPNICQILLQFNSYTSAGATPDGNCDSDRLRITGSVTVDDNFVTCGTLTQQHMFLTFGSQDTIDVTPIVRSMAGFYDITATKIACDSPQRAPDYCLQYFTMPTGTVRSFDFTGQQQNNQRYTICVKPTPQSTEIRWAPCPGVNRAIDITTSGMIDAATCERDWIQPKGEVRVCESLTSPIASSWKPYELLVNFDESEYPKPPTFFPKPIVGECNDGPGGNCAPDNVPGLACGCLESLPNPMACQCTMDLAQLPDAMSWAGDFDNTGFCLNYTQI